MTMHLEARLATGIHDAGPKGGIWPLSLAEPRPSGRPAGFGVLISSPGPRSLSTAREAVGRHQASGDGPRCSRSWRTEDRPTTTAEGQPRGRQVAARESRQRHGADKFSLAQVPVQQHLIHADNNRESGHESRVRNSVPPNGEGDIEHEQHRGHQDKSAQSPI
jgi:hypothetical protein